MKDFNSVVRYDPEDMRVGEMPWQTSRADMWEDVTGSYVSYQNYKELLEAYQELKFILEGLEK